MIERSIYLIKPEASSWRAAIQGMIQKAGLHIDAVFAIHMMRPLLETMYPNERQKGDEVWATIVDHLDTRLCVGGIVSGATAVETLLNVCGASANPNECELQTIRREYGLKHPVRLRSGAQYWRNAIHRPENLDQAIQTIIAVSPPLLQTGS